MANSSESSSFSFAASAPEEKYGVSSWRSDVAMFVERHRNRLAMGVLGVGALLVVVLLVSPALPAGAGGEAGEAEQVGVTMLLEEARVIPDVLDAFSPSAEIALALGSRQLLDGAAMPLADAQQPPSLTIRPTNAGVPTSGRYVLVVVDPDAPSPEEPTQREWLHWMVADIAPEVTLAPDSTSAKVVVPYAKPTPPTGTHRYVFVAFSQPPDMPELTAPPERGKFSTRDFMKKNSLGPPVAALYFTTEKAAG